MGDWRKLWIELQRRSGIVFTIGAALSFANAIAALQFVIDGWYFLIAHVENVPVIEQIARLIGAIVGAILEWWRGVLRILFGWLHLSLPDWVIDVGSAISFVAGRGVFRWLDLNGKVREAAQEAQEADAKTYEDTGADARSRLLTAAKAGAAQSAFQKRRQRLPADVALTVLALSAFFATLYAIDAWYRTL